MILAGALCINLACFERGDILTTKLPAKNFRQRPDRVQSVAEQLPAQATRMGFPDVDWKLYLQRTEAPQPDITDLIRALKSAARLQLF
jgi:hypothetical protein